MTPKLCRVADVPLEKPRVERVGRGQRGDRALERAAARADRDEARAAEKEKDTEKAERLTKEIVINVSPRETRIGIALFFIALTLAAVIDYGDSGDSFFGQVFVVFAWVALWAPAYRMITAASFRLARRRFAELAQAEVRVYWDAG